MYRCMVGLLLCLSSLNSFATCNLTVRVTEYAPLYSKSASGEWQGLAVELVEALFKEAQCDITFVDMPWNRALRLLEVGGLDVMLNMTATEERGLFTHFVGPMLDETQVLIVPSDSHYPITQLEDLKQLPRRIGIGKGVFYGRAFADKILQDEAFAVKFEYANNSENLAKLQRGRVSAIIANRYISAYSIQHILSPGMFKLHPYPVTETYIQFGFSRKSVNKTLLKVFQQAYVIIDRKGILMQIQQKYQ